MDPLDLNGLRVFAVSAQTGSFTEAAEKLRLTPSAVSKAVRRLEASQEWCKVRMRSRESGDRAK